MIGSRRRGARDSDDLPKLTVESDLTRVVANQCKLLFALCCDE